MRILGIDTSCDDTSAAVVDDGVMVRSSVVSGQVTVHRKFGGIVPELASREHIRVIGPVVRQALDDAGIGEDGIDAVAVCNGPGLVGSLLVGVSFAKGLCMRTGLPLTAVNHLEGHVFAAFLEEDRPDFPFVALVVSGGHTSLYDVAGVGCYREIGRTRDDAAGEAYDKVAKLMGLGYPGGPEIDRLAQRGDGTAVRLPRPFPGPSPDFSFSGLKTAVMNTLRARDDLAPEDVAASFQEKVVDVLVAKTIREAQRLGRERIVLSGGVAANAALRSVFAGTAANQGLRAFLPSPRYCTDNAAMIAAAGFHHGTNGHWSGLDLNARAAYPLRSWMVEAGTDEVRRK